jgi:hypothetical protein
MAAALDFRLVTGFRFRCLPDCGLCCYTRPAVAPGEGERLVQLDPDVPLENSRAGWANIASRPEGGACHFLRDSRCGCHSVRPATCAEFPLVVHASGRVQVSVVLTCPGVDLGTLPLWSEGVPSVQLSTDLAGELAATHQEVLRAESAGEVHQALIIRRQTERRLGRQGRWQPEDEIRGRLRSRLLSLIPSELPLEEEPTEEEELESLPLFYEPGVGRVARRPRAGGLEFLSLREEGGIAAHLGVLAPPGRAPALEPAGAAMLHGYLRYLLERDTTIAAVYLRLLEGDEGLPDQGVENDLREAAGQVLLMATLRRALVSGRRGALSAADIENGVRAVDMDLLDRPATDRRL